MKKKICVRCVMDTSDPEIIFDNEGVCNHCNNFLERSKKEWFPDESGYKKLITLCEKIKREGQKKEYDCILGLSGGVDSSYLAIKIHELGLRPLVVHIDAGWNSELAVANIERVVNYCGYDLYTHVVDWEEIRDLQLAYLRSGVANQDVPQDHIFFATLYHLSIKKNIRYILSGGNIATEAIFPEAWHASAMDSINLKAIHKRFGSGKLKNYKTISFFNCYILYPFFYKMRTIRPLNFMPYVKHEALVELEKKIGYKAYPRKHGESLFTKFFQNYYLPSKFGYDKRLPHFSSLIVSGQMSRDDALSKLQEPLYDFQELESDLTYFCKKMQITRDYFNELMDAPPHHYSDFANWDWRYKLLKNIQKFIERLLGKRVGVYS